MTTSDKLNFDTADPGAIIGAPVHDKNGGKFGKVDALYVGADSGRPEWAAVKSGLFGSHVSLVPLVRGNWDGAALTVPFDKDALKAAPHHDPDDVLNKTDEQDLYRHYGLSGPRPGAASGEHPGQRPAGDRSGDPAGERGRGRHESAGPDNAMTRSEEQLRVGTETRESGRARLRKYIVTENVTRTVPVSHEEVALEREPITDANRGDATSGEHLTEDEHEVTLHEERVVTEKETVPVERVRLDTETVTDEATVDETLRKERIDAESTNGVDLGRTGRRQDRPGDPNH